MFRRSIRFYLLICLLSCISTSFAQDKQIAQKLDELKNGNNLSEWLYSRIDYVTAHPNQLPFLMATQKQLWRQPANTNEHIAWMTLLSSQGYNQLQAGDILASIDAYEEAYRYYYKYKLVQFDIVEYVFKPLGNNYTRLGDNERALFIQLKSVAHLNAFDNSDDVASVYSNIAITCYTMGNYPDALRYINKGLTIAKEPEVYFRLQNTLANVLYEQGELTKAKAVLKQVIALQKPETKAYYSLYNAYNTLGNIAVKDSALNAAEKYFITALKMINTEWLRDDYMRERAATTAQLGKIKRLQRQPQKALNILNDALHMLKINATDNRTNNQSIYGEINLVDIFREKSLTYIQLAQAVPALENMRYALLATDKVRAEFADDKTRERLQAESRDMTEIAIEQAFNIANARFNDKTQLLPILELSEQSKARTLADQINKNQRQVTLKGTDTVFKRRLALERAIAYDERMLMDEKGSMVYQKKIAALKFELALLNKQHHEQNAASLLSAAAMLESLPDSLRVFEYFLGKRSLYIINIKNRKIEQVTQIGQADGIKSDVNLLVNKYYRNGPGAMLNSPKAFYHLSYEVCSTLLNHTLPSKNERICFVPDDVLGYLSFDGLITKEKYDPAISQWPFLIRQATTSYAFSLNTLLQNRGQNHSGIGFGGLFITHDEANDKPIMAVKKESAAIKQLVKGDYLYDDEVNTQSFFNSFENSAALHISTHAYLSGLDKEPTLDFGKEKLYLFELLARQHKPNLVVLSACRTGDGLLAKGEGIISLSRGFSAIGTPATIAGLWNVNDDAVSQITANIYKGLVNGQSSGTALHTAKLSWLNTQQASDAMYLPYYWDSLILMGADEPVHLQPAGNNTWLYGLMVGLLGIGFFVMIKKRRSFTEK